MGNKKPQTCIVILLYCVKVDYYMYIYDQT